MKEYDVEITETLQKIVTVRAESREEAEALVEDRWNNEEYILTSDDFVRADFASLEERELAPPKLDVLLIQPERHPQAVQIENTLQALQKAVGGTIQAVYPFDDPVALVANNEGKISGLPSNRALRDDNGSEYDILCGDFLVVGLGDTDFCSLTPELAQKYEQLFHQPELFLQTGRGLTAIPLPDDIVEARQRLRESKAAEKAGPKKERPKHKEENTL